MQCLECSDEFSTERGLHLHISKKHKVSLENYYHKYVPRFDKYSKELIVFKNFEDYSHRDFNTKENFAKWCFSEDPSEVKSYVVKAFKTRAEDKESLLVPSNVELKSLFLPSWLGLLRIFGSRENVIKAFSKAGMKFKYNYLSDPSFSEEEPEYLVDTREQLPLDLPNSKKMKLSCGDYTTSGPLFSDVFIERKSLEDLVSTLTSGASRFQDEIERADDFGYYLIVLIENKVSNTINYGPENSFSKYINGKFVFHKIREICSKYKNIQFLFSDSRENSKILMSKIFKMKSSVRNYDLEFLKDIKVI